MNIVIKELFVFQATGPQIAKPVVEYEAPFAGTSRMMPINMKKGLMLIFGLGQNSGPLPQSPN